MNKFSFYVHCCLVGAFTVAGIALWFHADPNDTQAFFQGMSEPFTLQRYCIRDNPLWVIAPVSVGLAVHYVYDELLHEPLGRFGLVVVVGCACVSLLAIISGFTLPPIWEVASPRASSF